jgi:FMN phosphatase YigB (HAD superfamily)
MMHEIAFLFDIDNTLLDNDRVQADLDMHLRVEHGTIARNRYWEIFEALWRELGYADYLGALERYRREDMHDPRITPAWPRRLVPARDDQPDNAVLLLEAAAAGTPNSSGAGAHTVPLIILDQ